MASSLQLINECTKTKCIASEQRKKSVHEMSVSKMSSLLDELLIKLPSFSRHSSIHCYFQPWLPIPSLLSRCVRLPLLCSFFIRSSKNCLNCYWFVVEASNRIDSRFLTVSNKSRFLYPASLAIVIRRRILSPPFSHPIPPPLFTRRVFAPSRPSFPIIISFQVTSISENGEIRLLHWPHKTREKWREKSIKRSLGNGLTTRVKWKRLREEEHSEAGIREKRNEREKQTYVIWRAPHFLFFILKLSSNFIHFHHFLFISVEEMRTEREVQIEIGTINRITSYNFAKEIKGSHASFCSPIFSEDFPGEVSFLALSPAHGLNLFPVFWLSWVINPNHFCLPQGFIFN